MRPKMKRTTKLDIGRDTLREMTLTVDSNAAVPVRTRVNTCVVCQITRPTRG